MISTSTLEMGVTRTGISELRRRWEASRPWASALIVHGLAEHSGRYERIGAHLASEGIETSSFDLTGFGASGGRRADVEDWSTYLTQAADNLAPLFVRNLPVMMFGHSMGGLIVMEYVLSRYRRPDLVVLSAPALDAVAPTWKKVGAPLLAKITPWLTLANPINPDDLFIDPEPARKYRTDPLMVTRTTVRLGHLFLQAMERVRRSLDLYEVPTLVLHGQEDVLVPTVTSTSLKSIPGVDIRLYEGMKHGSISGPEGSTMLDDLVAWASDYLDRAKVG